MIFRVCYSSMLCHFRIPSIFINCRYSPYFLRRADEASTRVDHEKRAERARHFQREGLPQKRE